MENLVIAITLCSVSIGKYFAAAAPASSGVNGFTFAAQPFHIGASSSHTSKKRQKEEGSPSSNGRKGHEYYI
jgi:hypothetical protein